MTKITQLKKLRVNLPDVLENEYQVVTPRHPYSCPICLRPMFLSIGQIQKCHKECRSEYKRIFKLQVKVGIINRDGSTKL